MGEVPIPRDGWATAPPPTSVPEAFADAFGFDAFEPYDEGTPPPEGARLLYRLRAGVKGRVREYLIRVELGPSADQSLTLYLTMTNSEPDATGEPERREIRTETWQCDLLIHELGTDEWTETTSLVPERCMRYGLFSAANAEREGVEHTDLGMDEDDLLLATFSPTLLLLSWQNNKTLARILREVIGMPPLLAGLRAMLEGEYKVTTAALEPPDSTVDLGPPVGALPSARARMAVLMGGANLLDLEVEAVGNTVPVCVGLGIVGMRGVRPSDPERWIAVDLLGARHE